MPDQDEPSEGGGGPPELMVDLLMIFTLFGVIGLILLLSA